MPRCCSKESVINIAGNRFCKEHFTKHFEKSVAKVLSRVKRSKVLAAVSGGKDSLAMLIAISKLKERFDIEVTACFIHLGIKGSSENGLKIVKNACNTLGVKLVTFDMKKELGFSIDEVAKLKLRRAVCSSCGMVKRYLLNKLAFESGFDYVATGHNLEDGASLLFINLSAQNIEQILRMGCCIPGDKLLKLAGRIKPLCYCTEREARLYCELHSIQYLTLECPYSKNVLQHKLKLIIEMFEGTLPNFRINLVKSFKKLRKLIQVETDSSVAACQRCGYPTTSGVCSFCRLLEMIKNDKTTR